MLKIFALIKEKITASSCVAYFFPNPLLIHRSTGLPIKLFRFGQWQPSEQNHKFSQTTIIFLPVNMIAFFRLKIWLGLALAFFSCAKEKPLPADGPMFNLLSPTQTGVQFTNNIVENAEVNHFKWDQLYAGGGVAIGDINNDGLPDIFFSGNMVADQLYLNKGNMTFEYITAAAGIIQDDKWSSGVTMADVNGDGWLDIYLCRWGYKTDPESRRNLLYINNGNNTFTESARTYKVHSDGFSTQASFFDMDKDGDLDMYLLNQPPNSRMITRLNINLEKIKEHLTDRLFRNDGSHFTDITQQAGIFNQAYGLNVAVSDLNQDGWPDVYVSNDYYEPDFLYINNKNGTFTDHAQKSLKHISLFAMGSDLADFNNDGLIDIAVADMASEDHLRSKTNMESMRPAFFWSNVKAGKALPIYVQHLATEQWQRLFQ